MKKFDHIHKYRRAELGVSRLPKVRAESDKKPYIIYRCVYPGCTHYLPESLVIGQESQCWGECGGIMVITQEDISFKKVKPKCRACIDTKKRRFEELRAL